MTSTTDYAASFKRIFEALKELEAENDPEMPTSKSIASLQEENTKLKERNICLEKKVTEQQTKLERLSTHYQSIVVAGQDLKNIQEMMLKGSPKLLEEENAALLDTISQMEVKLFHAAEESRQSQEKWQFHQQKMERLVDLIGQLMGRLGRLEKRMVTVSDTCGRIGPAAKAMAQRSAALQLAHSHSRCQLDQLTASLSEQRSQSAAKDSRLAATGARLQALEDEVVAFRTAVQEQRDEASLSKKQTVELQSRLEHLQKKLAEAQETMRDQSDLLSRMFTE